jgi:signal transduction histidine kinase
LATDEADQVLGTFQTVFSISRLQTQGKAPDQKLFSASDLAKDMSEWFEAVAWEKEIVFDTEITPSVMLMGNRDFLAQALSNILDNAFKYTPKGAGVTFRLRRNRAYEIEFSVTDTGPGVPLEDRERIVERFVRLEKSRNMPGVGLGLSMVQAVAQAHGGRLSIDEGPGVFENKGPGLRVAFILPDQSAN